MGVLCSGAEAAALMCRPHGAPGAAWACCWASLGCACVHSAPSPASSQCLSLPGSMIEWILVSCSNQQDLHEWVDRLQKQTKAASAGNPSSKPHSVPSHTVRAPPRPARRPRPGERGWASGLSADASSSPVGCGRLTGTHL